MCNIEGYLDLPVWVPNAAQKRVSNHHTLGYLYIYTWNLFGLYFGGWTLQNKVFSNQNKGHLGSRYVYAMCKVVKEMTDLKPAS